MKQKLSNWLRDANGWQRIWFVITCLALSFYTLINPFIETNKNTIPRYEYKWAMESEMKNPLCLEYMTKNINELTKPEYEQNGKVGCWHIYTHRQYKKPNTPITAKDYEDDFFYTEWKNIGLFSLMGFVIVSLLSAIVYGFGVIVSWIISGFKKTANLNEGEK